MYLPYFTAQLLGLCRGKFPEPLAIPCMLLWQPGACSLIPVAALNLYFEDSFRRIVFIESFQGKKVTGEL